MTAYAIKYKFAHLGITYFHFLGDIGRLTYSNQRRAVLPSCPMQSSNEAFSRVIIDSQRTTQGWSLADGFSVRYEVVLEDGTRADYVLCDRHGRFGRGYDKQ